MPAETALVGFTLPDGQRPDRGRGRARRARRGGRPGDERAPLAPARPGDRHGVGAGALASDGASITISDDGARLSASVVTEPFHDPAGELLRS